MKMDKGKAKLGVFILGGILLLALLWTKIMSMFAPKTPVGTTVTGTSASQAITGISSLANTFSRLFSSNPASAPAASVAVGNTASAAAAAAANNGFANAFPGNNAPTTSAPVPDTSSAADDFTSYDPDMLDTSSNYSLI
jgi:hypothetical protein